MPMTDCSKTRAWTLCLAVAAVLPALLAGCTAPEQAVFAVPLPYDYSGKGIATVKSFEGTVLVQTKRWRAWQKLTAPGVVVPDGAKVRTEKGRVVLAALGTGTIRLGPRALIDLNRERSMSVLFKRCTEFPIFLERGAATVAYVKKPLATLWITTEVFAAKLVKGEMRIAAPEPMAATCESGRVELRLVNGATVDLPTGASVVVKLLAKEEVRVRARTGRPTVRLDGKQSVTLAADGFDLAGQVCPVEVDVRRD